MRKFSVGQQVVAIGLPAEMGAKDAQYIGLSGVVVPSRLHMSDPNNNLVTVKHDRLRGLDDPAQGYTVWYEKDLATIFEYCLSEAQE